MNEKMVDKDEVLDILGDVIREASKTNAEVVIKFDEWSDNPKYPLTSKLTIKIKKKRWFWRWF